MEGEIDILHHNVIFDLSQNVHMTTRCNKAGVTECITPGGRFFCTKQGRAINGAEKLTLNGIPADELSLGRESEVEQQDLAGNAMSMPVVSAAMLAAFCAGAFARRRNTDEPSYKLPEPSASKRANPPSAKSGTSFELKDTLSELSKRAEDCSVLCTCESSGRVSLSAVQRCRCCLLSTCDKCASRRALSSHKGLTVLIDASSPSDPKRSLDKVAAFKRDLRRSVPGEIVVEALSLGYCFARGLCLQLVRIDRRRSRFELLYYQCAWAELRVDVGRLATGTGIRAILLDLCTIKRGVQTPVARLLLPDSEQQHWEQPRPRRANVEFRMRDAAGPSLRAECNLRDFDDEKWPCTLDVSGDETIAGSYRRESCRGMPVFGALWHCKAKKQWLFVDPDVDRDPTRDDKTGNDRLVIASSPTYLDGRAHHVAELLLPAKTTPLAWLRGFRGR